MHPNPEVHGLTNVPTQPSRPGTDVNDCVTFTQSSQTLIKRITIDFVEGLTGRAALRRLFAQYRAERSRPEYQHESFFDSAMRLLKLDIRFDEHALAKVPQDGPVLFIANHPYGVVDGMALSWLALKVRPECKVLGIDALNRAPEVQPYFLPIDFSGTPDGRDRTIASRRAAVAALKAGRAIAIFPGGGVGVAENPFAPHALDLPWIEFTGRLASIDGVRVVPIYFAGQNSWKYQTASRISATLRAALVCHETWRMIGRSIHVTIGQPIDKSEFDRFVDRPSLVQELRRRTFALADRPDIDWMKICPLPPDLRHRTPKESPRLTSNIDPAG